jgi:1-aminocyclopropane-1-carboxylate deaminase/D-cysteine desulfhydrase-like pyridoxal-dependent ACC family enzyme
MQKPDESKAVIQEILLTRNHSQKVFLKRADLIHPALSGNKWYKLKYNLEEAKNKGYRKLLTFGGAYSNHIYATAAAGKIFNFKTIGIIRGEEHLPLNSTLKFAREMGMEFYYLDRKSYRGIHSQNLPEWIYKKFGDAYILPEGGSNLLAVKGCSELVENHKNDFDYFCSAAGTGGTSAGIISGLDGNKKFIGFSVLKGGDFLKDNIRELIQKFSHKEYINWEVNLIYHFGGYAKLKPELIDFIDEFEDLNDIKLDYIYTGKMLYGINELLSKDYFPKDARILAIHTGGLQGNAGMQRYINKVRREK